jgi:putative ABC transport system permease protein
MSGLGKVVRSGVGRRRVQTIVIGLSAFMAVAAAVLAGSLLVASTEPFERSFTEQHGAHLTALFDGTKTTEAQAAATGSATGVAESSGPFAVVTRTPQVASGAGPGVPVGLDLPPLTIAGRANPTVGVDRVTVLEGRWPSAPNEILVTEDPPIGAVLTFTGLPGTPSFTVVGKARSASRSADAWVLPAAISSLTASGASPDYQMLYRFTAVTTAAEMDTAKVAVVSAAPADSLLGSQSWLVTKQAAGQANALFVPFLITFGLLGLIMAVLSVGGVVAGAVGAGTFRIGVLKAIGFTPAQVVQAYLGQALIPAGIGIALGVVGGNLLAIPVIASASDVYESTPTTVQPWVDVLVVVAAVAVVAATAWVASWRAGRLRTVDALAVGRAPAAGRGRLAASLAARLPLPRPVSLGLAQPFARPLRMVSMIATVTFGAASVALAVGLAASLARIESVREHDSPAVRVTEHKMVEKGSAPEGPPPGPSGPPKGPFAADRPDPAQVTAAIAAQSGTKASFGIVQVPATVAGITAEVEVLGYTADPRWAGFEMTEGRWYSSAGEAVVPTAMLTATGAKIGDTIKATVDGHAIPVRIVGEAFSTRHDGMQIFTDARTLTATIPMLRPQEYRVDLADGVDVTTFVTALEAAMQPFGLHANINPGGQSSMLAALNTLTGLLVVILVAVAALGVLNAVVLQTRERVRELGVHKAMGMSPRQAVTVVLSSVVLIGLLGGAVGVPVGVLLHSMMVPAMGESAGLRLPQALLDVYRPLLLTGLGLGGLAIAVLGALLPAGWAARTRTATALRTE